jgi:hypothetical protein
MRTKYKEISIIFIMLFAFTITVKACPPPPDPGCTVTGCSGCQSCETFSGLCVDDSANCQTNYDCCKGTCCGMGQQQVSSLTINVVELNSAFCVQGGLKQGGRSGPTDYTDCSSGFANNTTVVYDEEISKWVFNISGVIDWQFGICYDNIIEIYDGQDTVITQDNYCQIAWHAENGAAWLDPNPSNNYIYANTECIYEHELGHTQCFLSRLNDLIEDPPETFSFPDPINVDCSALSCQDINEWYSTTTASILQSLFFNAWQYTASYSEGDAIEAAKECMDSLVAGICAHASMESWSIPCSYVAPEMPYPTRSSCQ